MCLPSPRFSKAAARSAADNANSESKVCHSEPEAKNVGGERRGNSQVAFLKYLREQLNHGLQEVHRFSQDLRPSIIDDLGLSPALKSLVTFSDDGQGFELPPRTDEFLVSGKLGLAGMRERARLLGGALEVQSTPGEGTTITVEIPG